MPILITNTTKTVIPEQSLIDSIENVVKHEGCRISEISAIYCGDRFITRMNSSYLNHNYPTDTISFRLNEGRDLEGEFYISLHTVKRNARHFEVNFLEELFRVTIHSVLHLIGYDDQTPEEKQVMTRKEDEYLSAIYPIAT